MYICDLHFPMHQFYCCVNMKQPISHSMGFRVPCRYQCTCVLQEVGNIIYDLDGPLRASFEALPMGRLRFLTFKYLASNLFWKCWDDNWLFNPHVWMVEFWNLPYVGQDTNVTIEKYHTTLKVKKKLGKNRMVGGCKAVAKENIQERR